MHHRLWLTLVALAFLSSLLGCNMSLSASGAIGDQPVLLDGTGWAWLDETVYIPTGGGYELAPREASAMRLHLRFTSAVFDPTADLRSLPAAERARVLDDVARGDLLTMVVRRGDRVAAGDSFLWEAAGSDVPETAPWLSNMGLQLADPVLRGDEEYPEGVIPMGSARSGQLDLRAVGDRYVGEATFHVRLADDDAAGAGTGDVSVRFDVAQLGERLAECNWDPVGGGALNPCTLEPFSGGIPSSPLPGGP